MPGFAVADEGGLAVAWREFAVRTAKSSITNNFGGRVEHGPYWPELRKRLTKIVAVAKRLCPTDALNYGAARMC